MAPSPLRRWLPLVLLAMVALWLRTRDLEVRPMHADEANQAVKTGALLEHGEYRFDPQDHHGPTLYYAALPIAWIRGEHTLAALTETTVRLVPALAGTLAVLLLARLAAPAGRFTAIMAAAFFAVSPPAVYYSRYFIQETLLLTFTLAALVAAQTWWRRGGTGRAVATGVAVGLMLATKASAPLFLAAAAIALLIARPRAPKSSHLAIEAAAAALAALVVAMAFYASFGRNPGGLGDALASYTQGWRRAGGTSAHEQPWWSYARLFGWHREGGLLWHQLAFSALALAGAALTLTRWRQPHLVRAALYTLIIAAVFSVTPYKTPWHAIHWVPGLALMAAGALAAIPNPWVGATLAVTVLTLQLKQTELAVFLRPADARNPYAYVQSSSDVRRARALVEKALTGGDAHAVVRVIGEEYWPLPWYLRGLDRVGYWTTPPENCDGALLIVSSTQADAVRARLHGSYHESFLGLRPGFLCVVFTRLP